MTTIVITGENIHKVRLLALRGALRMEASGLRGKVNAAKIVRDMLEEAGIKAARNKTKLLEQFSEYIKPLT